VTFTIWQADQNSFGSDCVRVLARLQQWRRTHPNSRLADLFGVGATVNPDTRALGYARTLKRLMMERGAPAVIATLHDGYAAGRGIDYWPGIRG
jgi:hypothetical protein